MACRSYLIGGSVSQHEPEAGKKKNPFGNKPNRVLTPNTFRPVWDKHKVRNADNEISIIGAEQIWGVKGCEWNEPDKIPGVYGWAKDNDGNPNSQQFPCCGSFYEVDHSKTGQQQTGKDRTCALLKTG